MMVRSLGLIDDLDRNLHLLKLHLPYHESDHVLNIAYNFLAGGTCLEDIELLRNNEVYLDALETPRIPDPTTAGDFCRRFHSYHVVSLMETINEARLRVWRKQPESFFEEADKFITDYSSNFRLRIIRCYGDKACCFVYCGWS